MEFSQPIFSQAGGDGQAKSMVENFVVKLIAYGKQRSDDFTEAELFKMKGNLEKVNDARWLKIEDFVKERTVENGGSFFLEFATSWLRVVDYVCEGDVEVQLYNRLWKLALDMVFASILVSEDLKSLLKDGRVEDVYRKWLAVIDNEKSCHQFGSILRREEKNINFVVECYVDSEIIRKLENGHDAKNKSLMSLQLALLSTMVSLPKVSQIWRVLLTTWCEKDDLLPTNENEDPEARPVKRETSNWLVDDNLIKAVQVAAKAMSSTSPASAKLFQRIVKDEKWLALSSDFGLALWVVLSASERHHQTFAPELKKSLKRLWKIGEEMRETAWLSEGSIASLQQIVKRKTEELIEAVKKSKSARALFTKPMVSMFQSLIEQPGLGTTISIVDGRVSNAPAIWLMARDALSQIYLAQESITPELMSLISCITSSASANVAILFIDVLLELMKVFSVEISNLVAELSGFLEHICLVKKEVGVLLVRALLPVITYRDKMKTALFKSLSRDLLSDTTAEPAVQMMLLLLRSITKRQNPNLTITATIGTLNFTASQSFATFSTQSLRDIGMPKTVDQTLTLQLVGIMKRCLAQPYKTKLAMYEGIAEFVRQSDSVTNQFLDMLLNHAVRVTEWDKQNLVEATKTETTLKEPLQHLILTIDILTFQAQANEDNMLDVTAKNLLKRALSCMEKWVDNATVRDSSDLGLDKTTEWSPSTMEGRSNMLFAHLMIGVYDVLIKHIWTRLTHLYATSDADRLIGLLKRRMELSVLLSDKLLKRKEQKASSEDSNGISVDFSQAEVRIPAVALTSIIKTILPSDTNGLSPEAIKFRKEVIESTQRDLLNWAIDRLHELSTELSKDYRPMHSVLASVGALGSAARLLLNLYTENDVVEWVKSADSGNTVKTKTIETYASIIVLICRKLKKDPLKVAKIWYKKPEDEAQHQKRFQINTQMVLHAHLMTCQLARVAVNDENHGIENEKRMGSHYEKQVRAMIKIASTVMPLCDDNGRTCYTKLFIRMIGMLKEQSFGNNQMLRDYLKLVLNAGINSHEFSEKVVPFMKQAIDDVLQELSEEDTDDGDSTYAFVTTQSYTVVVDLVIQFIEKTMATVRDTTLFVDEYCSRTDLLDTALCTVFKRMDEVSGLVTQVMTLYIQHHQQEEKVVQLLTEFFTTFDLIVKKILDIQKRLGTETLMEFKSLDALAAIVRQSLSSTLAVTDNKVGLKKAPEKKSKQNVNTKRKKLRREETMFVEYTKQRETLQSRILTLSKTLKDDRFDLIVKNNSVGHRDFRITFEMVRGVMANDNARGDDGAPKKKKARKQKDSAPDQPEAAETQELTSPVQDNLDDVRKDVAEVEIKDEPPDADVSAVY